MIRLLLAAAGGASTLTAKWVSTDFILARLAAGFTKAAGNPVLAKGTAGAFDDAQVRELLPVIDEDGLPVTEAGSMIAYYGGFPDLTGTDPWKIGRATSTDNGVTWTKYASNPVISNSGTGWYQNDVAQPSAVKLDDGTYVMMATGRDSGDIDSIGCLSSADGFTWSDEGQKLVRADFADGVTAIDEMGVPSLIKRSSGDWLCLVECLKSGVTNGWRVFGATASDPTGTWTPLNSGQPLLSPTGAGWESVGVANAHIIENMPGHYFIAYNGITGTAMWNLGIAYGTDLTSLTRYSGNPVLSPGGGGAWDNQHTEASFLFKEPASATLRVLYNGFSSTGPAAQIGLATA